MMTGWFLHLLNRKIEVYISVLVKLLWIFLLNLFHKTDDNDGAVPAVVNIPRKVKVDATGIVATSTEKMINSKLKHTGENLIAEHNRFQSVNFNYSQVALTASLTCAFT